MGGILIVDDSSSIRTVASKILVDAGIPQDAICVAVDGVDGLAKLDEREFDLILSDINMPNMNGIEFVAAVRERGLKVPIINISSEGEDELLISALKAGSTGCIKKSMYFKLLELLSVFFKPQQGN